MTVANSLQPSFIIKSASNAGAAAEAAAENAEAAAEVAEACKDFRHADRVTAAGGIFYSPYSLKIFHSIAARISAMSYMTFSKS